MKLSKLFVYFSVVVFAFVLFLYLFTSNFIWLVLALGLSLFIARNEKIKKFGLLLFVVSFLVRLAVIIVLNFPQVYDFATLLDASHMFASGDYSFNQWWHFHTWGYQTGFVIYQGFLLKLFNSEFLLKLLNVLYSSLLVLFIYKLGKRISDEKSARVASILYMIFPFYLFLNTVMVNSHLATILMYFGILFLIKKEKSFKDYLIAGVFISLGNIIRPEGIIVVLTLLVYEFFLFNKRDVINAVIRVVSFFIVYFSIGCFASFLVVKSGVNPSGLSNKDPLWKFVLGFNYETCGYYNDDDSKYQVDRETEINIIKERAFGDLSRTGKLMLCKIDHFWLSSGLDMETGSFNDKSMNVLGINVSFSDLSDIAVDFNQGVHIFIFSMFLLGIFVNRKKLSNEVLFLLIMCVITFFVFLFIEIQPRYAYFIHVSLFILASLGIKSVYEFIRKYNIKYLKKVL